MSEPYDVTEVRAAYDTVAPTYAAKVDPDVTDNPFDRGVLDTFATYVLADGGGRVGDLGCGPGRITAYLAGRGLDVVGVDLSPGMVEEARAGHPDLCFEVGDLAALPLEDGSLAGALAWYSLIHTPPQRRPAVLAELARVVRPAGRLVVAFQVGDEHVRHIGAYGHDVAMDGYRLPVDGISAGLEDVGFAVTATVVRAPEKWERTPQAYLLARRGPTGG